MPSIPPQFLPPTDYLPETINSIPGLDYPLRLNLAEVLLDAQVAAQGDKTAIFFDAQRITYEQLRQRVNRFANAMRQLGIGHNDRVMLRSHNQPEYLVWNFACWRIGAIPVLINHLNRAGEIAFKANDTEAVAICVHADCLEDVLLARQQCPHLQHIIVLGRGGPGVLDYQELVAGQSGEAESENTSRDDFGRLIYSSGTTGKPKGILNTLGGLLSVADTHGRHVLKIQKDDVLGGHPYFTFAFGSVNFTIYPWRFGASVSITPSFKPEYQFELIQRHRITKLFCVPTAFRMMLGVEDAGKQYDLTSLRLCQSAGEWLSGETAKAWKERFGTNILDSLGSGDLNYWLSTTEDTPIDKYGSSGVSVPGFENVVVDENFREVEPGVLGELVVRGPVGQTYWRRPDKQKEGVCPLDSPFRGWSRPGLLMVKDLDGYFWYKSRSDDMIVTSGYKIPAGEVEGALNDHGSVLESAVVDTPDDERSSLIKAFVVLRNGYEPSQELIAQLQNFVKSKIEPYKYPRIIEFIEAAQLPRTATGKIQRRILRDWEYGRDTGNR